jgi:prepilin-type N-terminal cleavage/methylation domain-containing protein
VKRTRSAFTLIELLVAMALGTMLVGITSFIFMSARKVYDQSLQEIATSNELRAGFDRLGRDLYDVQTVPTTGWSTNVIRATDSTHGPDDSLELVTLERSETSATPIRVRMKLGARDEDGLAPLVRTVTHRGVDAATGQLLDVADSDQVLVNRVRSFLVEYSWPSQGRYVTPNDSNNAAHVFIRGNGVGPWSGPPPDAGARFVYSSTGTIDKGRITINGSRYEGATRVVPRQLARTLYLRYTGATPSIEYALPIVEVFDASTIVVLGAPTNGPVSFWIPLPPRAFQITIKHEGRNGPRSVTEVLKVAQ